MEVAEEHPPCVIWSFPHVREACAGATGFSCFRNSDPRLQNDRELSYRGIIWYRIQNIQILRETSDGESKAESIDGEAGIFQEHATYCVLNEK
jgi:hypothetical protein